MKKPSVDAEVFGDEPHLAGGVIVVVTLVGIAMTVEVGDESFCQRVVEHRLAAVVLLLQLGQLATLLFTTAAAYQLTDRYKA